MVSTPFVTYPIFVQYRYLIILLLILANHTVFSAGQRAALGINQTAALCKAPDQIVPPRPQAPDTTDELIHVDADEALVQEQLGISTFSGSVLLRRADQVLLTPSVVYNYDQDTLETDQEFTLWDDELVVKGSKLHLRPRHQGDMQNATYWLLGQKRGQPQRGRGTAELIIQENKDLAHLKKFTYTTCDPDNETWHLTARETTLNNETQQGVARNVTVRMFGLPIFYTPYLSFPLTDGRMSGFLTPQVGLSSRAGLEVNLPYYWNLAPNYDLTTTPRIMTKRGILFKNEFRYLTESTGGQLNVDYIPYDNVFSKERSSIAFKHNGAITKNWLTDININYVSDNQYFQDLGNTLSAVNIIQLERRGDLIYVGNGWGVLARLQQFQTLDLNPAARPYDRLPQLNFVTQLPEQNLRLSPSLQAEVVRFDRDTNMMPAPIGNRFDVKGALSYPWRTPGTFIVPKLSLRYTQYDLSHLTTSTGSVSDAEKTPSRSIFSFTTDSGLFFDRDVTLFDTPLTQTLEPRAFYRYTPYRDQTALPIFDTTLYDMSFNQLFRDDSFVGADRVSDANQLALALTSRLHQQSNGAELLRASIGQIFYFRDRRVTLPGMPIQTDKTSSIVGELGVQLTKSWSGAATMVWNPHTKTTEQSSVRVRYRPDAQRILNLAYRLRKDILEQVDVSWSYPISTQWSTVGRWNYSLPDKKDVETFVGLEYNSCCWAIRGIVRRFLNNINGDIIGNSSNYTSGFFIELELKGLGGFGKKADPFLKQSIPGFNNQF